MSFQICLSGHPVESNVSYCTYRRAAHVATVRYSDPPVDRPSCPHIPRRTWLEKGYRIEPAQGRPLPAEDWQIQAIQDPGHVCRAPWGVALGTIEHRPKAPDYEKNCKAAHREKMLDFRARTYFRDLERRQGGGSNDAQCWHQMNNGLPCLRPRGHQGEHSL